MNFKQLSIIATLTSSCVLSGCSVVAQEAITAYERHQDPEKMQCKKTYHMPIRAGMLYGFANEYKNNNTYAHKSGPIKINFTESDDMNDDGKATYAEHFWTMPVGTTIPSQSTVIFAEARPDYHIKKTPKQRKKDNIYIEYMQFSSSTGGGGWTKDCVFYEVTWFGDGIIDKDFGETCDIADPTKEGWVNGQCLPPKPRT